MLRELVATARQVPTDDLLRVAYDAMAQEFADAVSEQRFDDAERIASEMLA